LEERRLFARTLRKSPTDAERRLWRELRRLQLDGMHFRRQAVVGPYVVDFLCASRKLAIELDGGQHAERAEYDLRHSQHLAAIGIRVLRFWNHDVLLRTDAVLEEILRNAGKA
jgi:very-short-patch-repair endonuclease